MIGANAEILILIVHFENIGFANSNGNIII